MHIGASAALELPNAASRSAEEWISAETSRAEAAPEPEATVAAEAASDDASSAGAGAAAATGSSAFFDDAPIPADRASISPSSSAADSSATGAYEPVSSWRARSSAVWMPMYDRVSKSR